MTDLKFKDADPACRDFQYLEDLSTAYWYSETLFAAISLRVFDYLEKGFSNIQALARAASCRQKELFRLLKTLQAMALVYKHDESWYNSQVASMYLVSGRHGYMGEFLLYRQYMQANWQMLVQKISLDPDSVKKFSRDDDYEKRNLNYVKATDALILRKCGEIVTLLKRVEWDLPVLDIGGGAGSLGRFLIRSKIDDHRTGPLQQKGHSALLELPEVIQAARILYPEASDWQGMETLPGDLRDHVFDSDQQYGLVIVGNFLHAYEQNEAMTLLHKALGCVRPGGMALIHDYFPDRTAVFPQKGVLYDLNMMLNTYNGECHESRRVIEWLRNAGFGHAEVIDLKTDTSVILASDAPDFRKVSVVPDMAQSDQHWVYAALEAGFKRAVPMEPDRICLGPWVRRKCQYGCGNFGNNLQCPPHGMTDEETRQMLASYSRAVVVEGMPPSRDFHEKLLHLEKQAFLAGFHKAFVFGAGPCTICPECVVDRPCRRPDLARPAMEASGIDVYETARAAGIHLTPVTEKGQYVKYMGLLLLV